MANLIFGCGYLGERVATRWRNEGNEVAIVTRNEGRARKFKRQGYKAIVADISRPETLSGLPGSETVLFAVGFDRSAGGSIEEIYAGGLQNVLAALPSAINRFIYISTTGVYGPAGGEWVDEDTPPDPRRDGGRASHAAEQVLAAHPLGKGSVILRLAGIYGPGRIPFLDQLRAGQPIPAPSAGHLNLFPVEDAASVVVAASSLAPFVEGPHVYCVSDGQPVQRGDYYREVARQIGAPPPQFMAPDPNSPRAARADADRRIRNERMLADLKVQLAYPDYRVGLAAILG